MMRITLSVSRLGGVKVASAAAVIAAMTLALTTSPSAYAVGIIYEGFGYTSTNANGVNYFGIADAASAQEILDGGLDEFGEPVVTDTGTYDGLDDGTAGINPNTGAQDTLLGDPARQGGTGSWLPNMGWTLRSPKNAGTSTIDPTSTLGYTDSQGKELVTTMGKVKFLETAWSETWRPFDASTIDPGLTIPNTGAEGGSEKDFETPTLGKQGTVVWLSYLSDRAGSDGGNNSLQLYNKREALSSAGSPQDRTGGIASVDDEDWFFWQTNKGDAEGMHPVGTRGNLSGSLAASANGAVFVVAKLDYGATTGSSTDGWADITTWVNPDLGSEPTNATAASQSDGYIPFNALYINSPGGSGDQSMDELRLGTTYADVAPIVGAGLDGDFDEDGDVDGDDFLVWQRGAATPGDLTLWQNNYGSPASGANASGVPEPTSLVLLSLAGAMCCLRRRQ